MPKKNTLDGYSTDYLVQTIFSNS